MKYSSQKPLLSKYQNYIKLLKKIDDKRFYSNFGPLYFKLKKKLEKKLRLKKFSITFTSNGHSAIQACCNLIAHNNKKELIIIPSFSFASNPLSILSSGLKPYFVDIDPHSLEMDYKDADQVIRKNRKNIAAIMICSPFGYPINLDKTINFFSKYKVPIIFDFADAIINTTNFKEKKNLFYTFSFHPTKNIASNESGMIIAEKKKEEVLKSIINFGFYGKNRRIAFRGFNGKFSEYDAAILEANLRDFNKRRKKITEISRYLVSKLNNKSLIVQKNYGLNWFSMKMVLIHKTKNFEEIFKKLKRKNIEIFKPWSLESMHNYKPFKNFKKTKLKNTLKISKKIFCIPVYIDMKKKDLDYLINQLNKI